MTQDNRFTGGGHEYGFQPQAPAREAQPQAYQPQPPQTAAQPYIPPQVEEYAPQPVMRAAPQGYAPQQLTPGTYAAQPPAAAPAPAPAASSDPDVVTLSRAYKAHDLDVLQVRFRKPSTKDLRKCGYPMRNVFAPGGGIAGIDELPDVVARYISILSEPPLPPSTIDTMDIEDFSKCSAVVLGFFLG